MSDYTSRDLLMSAGLYEDRTVAQPSHDAFARVCEELAGFDTKPPPAEFANFDPCADGPTRVVAPATDSNDALDADALFADLPLSTPTPAVPESLGAIYTKGVGTMLPTMLPNSAAVEPASMAYAVTEYAPIPRSSRDVATRRSRRPPPPAFETGRSRLVAVAVAGSLALIGALGACVLFSGLA